MKSMKFKQFQRYLLANDFVRVNRSGDKSSHQTYKHASGAIVSVPQHPGDVKMKYIKEASKIINPSNAKTFD